MRRGGATQNDGRNRPLFFKNIIGTNSSERSLGRGASDDLYETADLASPGAASDLARKLIGKIPVDAGSRHDRWACPNLFKERSVFMETTGNDVPGTIDTPRAMQ